MWMDEELVVCLNRRKDKARLTVKTTPSPEHAHLKSPLSSQAARVRWQLFGWKLDQRGQPTKFLEINSLDQLQFIQRDSVSKYSQYYSRLVVILFFGNFFSSFKKSFFLLVVRHLPPLPPLSGPIIKKNLFAASLSETCCPLLRAAYLGRNLLYRKRQ